MTERRGEQSWRTTMRPIAPLGALWLAGACLLVLLIGKSSVPSEQLLLDPTHYQNRPWYTGLISNLGVLGWTTATVAAAGGSWISRAGDRRAAADMLREGALLSSLLLLDDLFQLHIVVAKAVGASKLAFYIIYVALATAWVTTNVRELLRTRWPLLVAAIGALLTSVIADQLMSGTGRGLITEDSAKFFGILAWALFFVLTARDIAHSVLTELVTTVRQLTGPEHSLGAQPSRPGSDNHLQGAEP
ncbi:MAG: hypothetical protein GY773_11790 [Actinomycetia bacterium]|nr:hypothetical protein [Actinomycetes bacterium]